MAKADDFIEWLQHAEPGGWFTYWTGYLAADRGGWFGGLSPASKVGSLAWKAYEAGLVRLVQKRNDEGKFNYYAVRRGS